MTYKGQTESVGNTISGKSRTAAAESSTLTATTTKEELDEQGNYETKQQKTNKHDIRKDRQKVFCFIISNTSRTTTKKEEEEIEAEDKNDTNVQITVLELFVAMLPRK